MKHFTLLFNLPLIIVTIIIGTISSCGRPVTDDCQKKPFNLLCHAFYNEEAPKESPDLEVLTNADRQLEAKVIANNARIEAILLRLDLLDASIDGLSVQLSDLIADIILIDNQITALDSEHDSFISQFTTLNNQLTIISNTVSTLSQGSITEIVDLCSNHKEVLIRLGDGSLLSLSGGNKAKEHHLQVLTPGDYKSQDGEDCEFTVSNDLSVSW